MSKLYLHKIDTGNFKTTKDTIIADISKIREDFRPKVYRYKDNFLHKKPKKFILTGGLIHERLFSNISFLDFPVDKVLIDSNIHSHRLGIHGFNEAKELEIGSNVKKVEIYNSYGLNNIEKIIIPFSIENFSNDFIHSVKIKTIVIKHEKDELNLELDDVFKVRQLDIDVSNNDKMLEIFINSKNSCIKYEVYLNDDKLEYTKNYLSYEIKPNEETVLDLIKLKEKYNCKLKPYLGLKKEKVILTKEYYNFLDYLDKSSLKELIIKDSNDMSLFPRTIELNGSFKQIEVFKNKVFIHLMDKNNKSRYILINDDLNYIDLEMNLSKNFNVYLDLDSNNLNIEKDEEIYNITIPYMKDYKLRDSKIIKHLVHMANKIYIKNKNTTEKIDKFINNNVYLISNIERYSEKDLIIYYDMIGEDETYQHIIYVYDEEKVKWHKTLGKESTSYHEAEYKKIKKLIKK